MATGRKRKPTKLRILQGNPGKRPISEAEIRPESKIPDTPTELEGVALDEWHRITVLLDAVGLLADLDRTALLAYCIEYARYLDAVEKIKATSSIVKAPSGYPMVNPYLSIANQALKQVRGLLSEFGMTPSSRSGLQVSPQKPKSEFDKWRESKKRGRP